MKLILKVILVLVVFFSCFSNVKEINRLLNANYFLPFQYIRDNSIVFKLGFIGMFVSYSIFYYSKNRPKFKIIYFFKTLFFFKLIICFKYIYQVNSFFGLFELILYGCLVFCFSIVYSIFNVKDYKDVLFGLLLVFVSLNLVQMLIDFPMMFINGRFVSFTGNPQHAAMAIVGLIPIALVNLKNSTYRDKVVNVFLLVILIVLLLLTGSRTGLATCVVLFFIYYLKNLNKFFIHSLVAFSVFVLLFDFIGSFDFEVTNVFDRLESNGLDINRTSGFTRNFKTFLENPIFGGVVEDRFVYVENSYLACLSNFGIVGLIFLLIPLYHVFRLALTSFNSDIAVVNLASAILLSYFVGALFEAYLLANISFSFFCFILYYLLLKQTLATNYKNISDEN